MAIDLPNSNRGTPMQRTPIQQSVEKESVCGEAGSEDARNSGQVCQISRRSFAAPPRWENNLTSKRLSGVLVIALSLVLGIPAQSRTSSTNTAPSGKRPAIVSEPIGPTPSTGAVIGVIAGVVAAVVIVVILTVHYSK